nr:reverse transcriptase domain-containing protein [Tanacetum cinerariifolium]
MRYSSTYDDNSVNRVDVVDIALEEYPQDVLDFKYNSKNGNPTVVSNPSLSKETKIEFCKEPIVKSSSTTLIPFGEIDFFLEEIKDILKDESIPTGIEDSSYDLEGETLNKKLTKAPILVVPDWNLPFELMCDVIDFAIGAVLGQRKMKHFQPIHYASKTMTEAQIHYTTTKKEMLAVVYAVEKFRPYPSCLKV